MIELLQGLGAAAARFASRARTYGGGGGRPGNSGNAGHGVFERSVGYRIRDKDNHSLVDLAPIPRPFLKKTGFLLCSPWLKPLPGGRMMLAK